MALSTLRTLCLLFGLAGAQQKQEIQISGNAGWSGRIVRGDWTPVSIDLDNRGKEDKEIVLAITWAAPGASQSEANPTLQSLGARFGPVHEFPLSVPARSRKRFSVPVLAPDVDRLSIWAFALDAKSRRKLTHFEFLTRPLDARKRLVAIVGGARPDGLTLPDVEVAWIRPDELPEDRQGYAALEALVWLDGKATEIRSTAQVDALKLWVSSGGRFVLSRSTTVDLTGTAISELLPVRLGTSREVDFLDGLTRVAQAPTGRALILESTVRRGAAALWQGSTPLVVHEASGAGSVSFVAVDLASPPLSDWMKAPNFWSWLLDLPLAPAPETDPRRGAPRVIGSNELAVHIGRFPDVAAPEIGGLFLLIILYLVVVGPLDYLLLRFFKRLELTWFTFPAYVVFFTLFILLVGGAFIQRAANQREIAVVDHYPQAKFRRQRALSAVLAPADVVYRCEDAEPVSSNFISRALFSDTSGEVSSVRITRGSGRVAENWLLQRGFTGLALADRCANAPSPVSYTIQSLTDGEAKLTIRNTGAAPYEAAMLVHKGGVYWVSEIPVGERTLSAPRNYGTVAQFAATDGLPPTTGQTQETRDDGRSGQIATEAELNPIVRKILIGLSFPDPAQRPDLHLTGMARGLNANRWIETGGTVLVAWPVAKEAQIRFDPAPSKRTSVVLSRFFQRPAP